MADNKLMTLDRTDDLSPKDRLLVDEFKEHGMPGLAAVDEVSISRIMDLYLSGKTYRQISQIVRVNKILIMYLSLRFNWFGLRAEFIHELEMNMRQKVLESKLESQDFLLQLGHMFRKKIGHNLQRYLQTDDTKFANDIDLKEVDRYIKIMETLHKLGNDVREGKPIVGLNMGDGVTITKKGNNEIEITPKQKGIREALRQFADMRREEEASSRKPPESSPMIEDIKGEDDNET
jgi:hypothetical protein